jgi:hypothetical protein
VSESFDGWHEVVSPDFHAVQEDRVALSVTQNSPTECSCAQDLIRCPELSRP